MSQCEDCQKTLTELSPGATQDWVADSPKEQDPEDDEPIVQELRNHPRYRLIRVLGRGGMGTVYQAQHKLLDRPVVLKVIRPDIVENPSVLERFQREAKLAARLTHPNIVSVYEAEKLGATQFLVMEFVDGVVLSDLVSQRGLLPVAESCELIRQAACGLQHVHEQNLVHRDIKPGNIIVSFEGSVKLLDLGLATLRDGKRLGGDLTSDGQFLGTVDFASPEQWESTRDVDIRSDIYSLGCTFYYLLAGQSPFPSSRYSTTMQQMWAHSQAPLPPIRELRPDVPGQIEQLIEQMTAKSVDDRFETPGDVADALGPFVEDCDLAEYVRTARRTTTSRLDLSRVTSASISKDKVSGGMRREVSRRAVVVGASVLAFSAVLFAVIGLLNRNGGGAKDNGGPETATAGSSEAPVRPLSREPVRVGVLHSRTGTMAISERSVVDATLLAIDEINEAGGVLGRPVEAVIEDGESDWPTFAAKAEKLISEHEVCTLFGCWTSASRKTVLPVLKKHDHLLFYPVQYEGLEESPNIVYTGAAPNQQIIPAVKWCVTALKRKRFFLVGSDYVFPRCANAIISDTVASQGGEIVGEEYLLLGESDASAIVERIVAAEPDVILNTINGDSNVSFFRTAGSWRHVRKDADGFVQYIGGGIKQPFGEGYRRGLRSLELLPIGRPAAES